MPLHLCTWRPADVPAHTPMIPGGGDIRGAARTAISILISINIDGSSNSASPKHQHGGDEQHGTTDERGAQWTNYP